MDHLTFMSTLLVFGLFSAPCSSQPNFDIPHEKYLEELRKEYLTLDVALGRPCNYTEYEYYMIPFWDNYFNFDKTFTVQHWDLVFNLRFPQIYVEFDEEFKVYDKTLYKYVHRDEFYEKEIDTMHVNKVTQREVELSRCFTGGPFVCDKVKLKCVCMDNPDWIQTDLMDEVTGEPILNEDPTPGKGQACGVRLNTRCHRHSFWVGTTYFDCLHHNFCHYRLNYCKEPHPVITWWVGGFGLV